jgi:hypothetical protein
MLRRYTRLLAEEFDDCLGQKISRRVHYGPAKDFTRHHHAFPRIPGEEERNDLIAYLETLK